MHPVNHKTRSGVEAYDADVAQLRSVWPEACQTNTYGRGYVSWYIERGPGGRAAPDANTIGTEKIGRRIEPYNEVRPVVAWEEAVHLLLRRDPTVVPPDPLPSTSLDTSSYLLGGGGIEAAAWSRARLAICLPAKTSALLVECTTRYAWEVLDDEPGDQPTLVPTWDTRRFLCVMAGLPVARTAMFDAAHAYLRALGLLYDPATGRMALRPHNDLLFYAPPLVRTRLLRALVCMELMAVLDAPRTVYPLRDFFKWNGAHLLVHARLIIAGRGNMPTHCDSLPVFNLLDSEMSRNLLSSPINPVNPLPRNLSVTGSAERVQGGASPDEAAVQPVPPVVAEAKDSAMKTDRLDRTVSCSDAIYLAAVDSLSLDRQPRAVIPLRTVKMGPLVSRADPGGVNHELSILKTLRNTTQWMIDVATCLYKEVSATVDVDWVALPAANTRKEPDLFEGACPFCNKPGVPKGSRETNPRYARMAGFWASVAAAIPAQPESAHPILARDTVWYRANIDVNTALDIWDVHCLTDQCDGKLIR